MVGEDGALCNRGTLHNSYASEFPPAQTSMSCVNKIDLFCCMNADDEKVADRGEEKIKYMEKRRRNMRSRRRERWRRS
jgi:hypothetical protein